jgi:hypothetical protein
MRLLFPERDQPRTKSDQLNMVVSDLSPKGSPGLRGRNASGTVATCYQNHSHHLCQKRSLQGRWLLLPHSPLAHRRSLVHSHPFRRARPLQSSRNLHSRRGSHASSAQSSASETHSRTGEAGGVESELTSAPTPEPPLPCTCQLAFKVRRVVASDMRNFEKACDPKGHIRSPSPKSRGS